MSPLWNACFGLLYQLVVVLFFVVVLFLRFIYLFILEKELSSEPGEGRRERENAGADSTQRQSGMWGSIPGPEIMASA